MKLLWQPLKQTFAMSRASGEVNPQITQMNADFQKPKRDPETYAVISAAMEFHRQLGNKIKNINLIGV